MKYAPRPNYKSIGQKIYDLMNNNGGSVTVSQVQALGGIKDRKHALTSLSNARTRGYVVKTGKKRWAIAPIEEYEKKRNIIKSVYEKPKLTVVPTLPKPERRMDWENAFHCLVSAMHTLGIEPKGVKHEL